MLGPGRAAQSYLDVERVVQAAVQARCSALHPGWGFLSENPLLATLCAQHGVTFIGPPPHVTALMGSKTRAKARDARRRPAGDPRQRRRARRSPTTPGASPTRSASRCCSRPRTAAAVAACASRAAPARSRRAYAEAQAEARAAFGGDRVFLEKLIEGGRHVEIQVFADRYGHAVHLGERDCTVQRNHQKLIEESPSPALTADQRAATLRGRGARGRARSATSAPARWRCCSTGGVAAVHGDELPAAGRAHGQRGAHRQGPRDRADRDRRRPAARVDARTRHPAHRPRHRVPDQRRGSGERLRAGARHDHRVAAADAATASASTPTSRPATSCRRSTTRCSRR